MDTDFIYTKLNISHDEYLKILEENKDLFGRFIGMMKPECIYNSIKELLAKVDDDPEWKYLLIFREESILSRFNFCYNILNINVFQT